MTLILLVAIGIWLALRGERVFSPGKLSTQSQLGMTLQGFSSHADFEQECQRCHQPLETTQDRLCLACHTSVQQQMETQSGTHGMIEAVTQCRLCHPDHRGRDFNMITPALALFDHSNTRFQLLRHSLDYQGAPLTCSSCHITGMDAQFGLIESVCRDCHSAADAGFMEQHVLDFGLDCLACHDGLDSMARFDHNTTQFPLEGKHAQSRCADCHQQGNFTDISPDCQTCHEEPAVHRGLFDPNCSLCHTALAWTPAIIEGHAFDHAVTTRFSLQRHTESFDGTAISCLTCHPQSVNNFEQTTCVQCHATGDAQFMNEHQALFGNDCLACHDGVDRFSNFDHASVFPLTGKHAGLDCATCHVNQQFLGMTSECVNCHQEPAIHAGWFGLKCQYCHNDTGWVPAKLKIHPFPLDHGQQSPSSCETCHPGAYNEYTCYQCHEHQPDAIARSHAAAGISAQELPACVQCHPAGEVQPQDTP